MDPMYVSLDLQKMTNERTRNEATQCASVYMNNNRWGLANFQESLAGNIYLPIGLGKTKPLIPLVHQYAYRAYH